VVNNEGARKQMVNNLSIDRYFTEYKLCIYEKCIVETCKNLNYETAAPGFNVLFKLN